MCSRNIYYKIYGLCTANQFPNDKGRILRILDPALALVSKSMLLPIPYEDESMNQGLD